MKAILEDEEMKDLIKHVEKELRKDYPEFVIKELIVEFDGVTLYVCCDFDEHKNMCDGDRLDLFIDIDDTPCYDDPFWKIPRYLRDELVCDIACRIEELNKEEEE